MNHPFGLVERAYPNAVGAIGSVLCPELEAFLTIHIPLERSGMVGDIVPLRGHLTFRDRLARTVGGTFFIIFAEGLGTQRPICVVTERQVCKYLTDSDPRAEFLSHQKS